MNGNHAFLQTSDPGTCTHCSQRMEEAGMKRHVIALGLTAVMMMGGSAYAADVESMSLDELKSAYTQLESEKAQLESENADLKAQVEELSASPETETEAPEPSTEVVGTTYTDSATVQIVQTALNEAGFDCGTPDGKAGDKTTEALKAYQASKGINVNGVITDELLETMDVQDQVSEAAKKESMKAEYSSDYSYNTIARDSESFKDTKVKFRGKVLQEGDSGEGISYIRLAVDSNYDTVLFVTYTSDQVSVRILEDDILTIYGTVVGDYSYETVMGATMTLPWVHSDMIDTSEVNMG